ncbi:MAG: hypothetical protein NC225_09110 [Clostridium sp.]|nr:hypothetical protein [Clostridium sp.]MCM1399621.1 hypothetical protein [Clostridium sp.]MCM1460481.1 hypothetical protein [Bacteroides sp.]
MAENVFNEKKDYLIGARDEVVKRDNMAAELEKLKTQQKKITKSIASEEKSIADEIAATLKKRKQEISNSYDERLDDNRARKKKVSTKRDKKKNQRINERIEDETKDIRKNTRELEVEMKTLFKKNKVPSFCATKLYFIMFMPRGIAEIFAMLLCCIIYFAGLPAAVTFIIKELVLSEKKDINMAFWCVLIVAVLVVLQLVIYFVTYNATKIKHGDVLMQGRSIRDKIKANKRQADAIKNSISKDKDESAYKLDVYDEKLANLDEEADAIGAEKQQALKAFEEDTKQLIIDDINGRRLQSVENMKAEKKSIEANITKLEKMYSDKVLQITNQYASFIGEELCREDKLSDIIAIMEEEQAETVSEAINLYKGQKSSK